MTHLGWFMMLLGVVMMGGSVLWAMDRKGPGRRENSDAIPPLACFIVGILTLMLGMIT